MVEGPVVRPLRVEDAPRFAALLAGSREFMRPWTPVREESFYTPTGQRDVVERHLGERRDGVGFPLVILDRGAVAGLVNLSGIMRGPFQSANLGYWVAPEANGRGLATAAVGAMLEAAFGELGLHRVQAATLPHNVRSQRVLERNGFTRIGYAPDYLEIEGRWQDHVLFQAIAPTPSRRNLAG